VPPARPLLRAEVLSVGTELTTGATRDTNAGELARDLSEAGVVVDRMTGLPDDHPALTAAIATALERVDLVIVTGGLGPTPDDLTREAIAAVAGETPTIDPDLEAWLRGLFDRRGVPFAAANLKQAWRIPSAVTIPNDNGTAPGWWVDRPDGRIVIALPGPPREMRPMWSDWVRPRLDDRGLGRPLVAVTLRTTGIGESVIADRLGPLLARDAEPIVATYARAEAVDVRISAHERPGLDAAAAVAASERIVAERLAGHVWARGTTSWGEALAAALDERGWQLSLVEVGSRGALLGLLGEGLAERLVFAEAMATRPEAHGGHEADPLYLARRVRDVGRTEAAVALEARARRGDTVASVAVITPDGEHHERRLAFLAGDLGRSRAAIAAAGVLLARLARP
jgi:nicotinamide-nucleotide amidase